MDVEIKSSIFSPEIITLGDTTEKIVRGGRDKFPLLPRAFAGIKQIGVIGWGSQGPAQAQNLRDSLTGSDINVKVGLREGSQSVAKANAAGFTAETGTLGEMYEVILQSDLVLLLISDSAQVKYLEKIFYCMRSGATLGLSHGFLLGHMKTVQKKWPKNINVIGVCPKGMGPSVRRLYEQGKQTNGAGINSSYAVEQDIGGRATDIALGWAIALGSPFVFKTTLENEYLSDLVGERGILLGAIHGIVEALYVHYLVERGMTTEKSFLASVSAITDRISPIISHRGIIGVYKQLKAAERQEFNRIFTIVYDPAYDLLEEIYDEVASGNEIHSVVMAGKRLEKRPMSTIENTPMWTVGARVREKNLQPPMGEIIVLTAATYIAVMMAQIDLLHAKGHPWSEICNESVIEAVDSLTPFMRSRGVAYMVDNCSTTARLGTRKWGPRWDYVIKKALATIESVGTYNTQIADQFTVHPIHEALAKCARFRPPVDIAVA